MAFLCKSVLLLAQLTFLFVVSIKCDMCGMPAPDPMKTCVSLRLPWNPQPMYFCTDKSVFRYRNQCQNRFSANCGVNTIRQDTLMVASPWDCCPMVSYPDSCVNQQCPPPPHNRKCQAMEPNINQPWECCPSYFCEENLTPETCHFKRLEPTCNSPPPGKTNCVAFVDPYGCCPKFQCDGDATARPGFCPAEVEAMKFMSRFNSTNVMLMGPGYPFPVPGGAPGMMVNPGQFVGAGAAATITAGAGSPAGQAEMHIESPPAGGAPPATPAEREGLAKISVAGFIANTNTNMIACVGDFNCPGNMKCCSNDMNVYVMDGRYFFRNKAPTYGYCMEATNAAGMNTKSIKYTQLDY